MNGTGCVKAIRDWTLHLVIVDVLHLEGALPLGMALELDNVHRRLRRRRHDDPALPTGVVVIIIGVEIVRHSDSGPVTRFVTRPTTRPLTGPPQERRPIHHPA